MSATEVAGRPGHTVTADDLSDLDALDNDDRRSVRAVKGATGWGSDKASAVLREWRARLGGDSH